MTEDIDGAMEYLNQIQEGYGISLIDHIGEVLIRLSDYCADRPIDFFEVVSYILKEERQPKDEIFAALKEKYGPDFVKEAEKEAMIRTQLFPKQKLTEEEEEEEANEQNDDEEKEDEEEYVNEEGEIPNVISDMRFLNEVGIGLNESETVLLQNAIQKLVKSKPLVTARFWGKVLGIEHDYYIAEAEFNDGERPHPEENDEEKEEANDDEENPENAEDKPRVVPPEEDSGPNQFSYFVCTKLGGPWTLLPDLTPAQIVASRCVRQMFSGKQDGPIRAPADRFPGGEYELLRCFIARVTHSCTVAPEGLYQLEEEPDEETPVENVTPIVINEEPVWKELKGLKSFQHRLPSILDQGRCEYYIFEEDTTDENGEEKEPFVEHGPPILRPISQDEPVGGLPSWSLRKVSVPQKRLWLRSNVWPGLNIVSNETGERLVMMYFGTGMKAVQPLEWPPLPEKKVPPPPPKEEEEEEEKGEKADGEEDTTEKTTEEDATQEESATYDSTYDGSSN